MESAQPLRCAPARRSLKFHAGENARHFLAFDPSISKYDRMIIYMELFAHLRRLVDSEVFPCFSPSSYLPEQYVELRVLTDPRHPAYGQVGLFAKKTIPSNTVVTPYSGYIEIFSTSCSSRTYTMGFGSLGDDYALDAEFVGNYGRFANDPRGVEGLSANLSAESRFTPRGEAYTALVSRRIINKGEEILMSYGKAHSLSPSPWVGLRGELLTRHRVGGIVPFPQLAQERRCEQNSRPERDLVKMNGCVVRSIENSGLDLKGQEDEARTLCGASGDKSPAGDEGAAMELLWECPQCGAWSIGSPTPVRIDHCFACQTPRLQRARLVAVCCTSPLGCDDLQGSVMRNEQCVPFSPPRMTEQQTAMDDRSAPGSPTASTSDGSSSVTNNNHNNNNTNGSGTQGPVVSFASELVNWPLNVPFLSWQVWDPAIPSSTIGKHSKFEMHENIFLYCVTTVNEDDNRQSGEGKRERDEAEDEARVEEQPKRRGRKPRVRRKKEELWQKEEPQPSETQQQRDIDGAKVEGKEVVSGGKTEDSSTTDYLFCISKTSAQSDNRHSGEDDGENTAALLALQSLLKGVPRRVFAGKSYHIGEVVASVGGVIRPIGDRRRRPDSSVLEIPMKYFVPSRLRHAPCSATLGSSDEMNDDELATLSDLLRRLESLSLVVTNELMFCPCLVLQDDENENVEGIGVKVENGTQSRQSLLGTCNVGLVLTMDSLGCPYVAAVALREITTFEPLFACIGY
ncbi:hypothetical protein DQ04_01291110 [Trypanosoma grayi]|uniref:hypothetical protein n=1 Tax=Trypanosoma grayi TaxID=71804 RepID=UPI0004F44C45|nr:hypothetical protein DQ04_01291110 [Trypanosoma grayi]KEG12981.1 hypothetical protein DQ04_01291110 [Trypanosoma grayi]